MTDTTLPDPFDLVAAVRMVDAIGHAEGDIVAAAFASLGYEAQGRVAALYEADGTRWQRLQYPAINWLSLVQQFQNIKTADDFCSVGAARR